MPWPPSQDYNEAIQNPATNFADPDLRRGEAATNALGLPMPYSGNFADVYQVRCRDGSRWAVKCFTREAPGLRDRYQEIGAHLRRMKLPFTVDFTYLEQGIRVVGKWYPVLKMEWVEGLTLNQFVAMNLNNPAMLEALLDRWQRVAKYLRAAKVGHCDLQHGNILLTPGEHVNSLALKLIDYDGMWVPALAGRKSGEVGHPSYQHPRRLREQSYNLDVDRFPVLLIATALRALRAQGKPLWEKYDNGYNLLFKEADLLAPLQSHLFLDLTKTGDALVSRMMDLLVKALRGRLEKAPLLDEVMPAEAAATHPVVRESRSAIRQASSLPRPKPVEATSIAAAPGNDELFDFAGSAETRHGSSVVHGKPAKGFRIGGVPRWAWAGGIAMLVAALGLTITAFIVLSNHVGEPAGQSPVAQSKLPVLPEKERTTAAGEFGAKPIQTPLSVPPNVTPQPGPADSVDLAIDPNPSGPPGEVRRFEGNANHIRRISVSPDGKQILTAGWDKTIRLWDVANGVELQKWDGDPGGVNSVCFLPDGKRALSCGRSKDLRLWDLQDDHEIHSFVAHSQGVHDLAVSKDGRFALSCDPDNTVYLWDVESGQIAKRLRGIAGGAECVAFSPDGRFALIGTNQGSFLLWDIPNDKISRHFDGHAGIVMAAVFSPNGRYVLSAGSDTTIRLWSVEDGREVQRFASYGRAVLCLAWSPDGKRFLVGGDGTPVGLWDMETRRQIFHFPGNGHEIWDVAFSPDRRYAFSAGEDGLVRLWRLPLAVPPPAEKWDALSLGNAEDTGVALKLPPQSSVSTKEEFSGPLEITVEAYTEKNNIRLHAFNGASVIFNWEVNPQELRVTRPDGNEKWESGTLATAKVPALEPYVWYTLRWGITEDGMDIFVDGKPVFSDRKKYDLSAKRPVVVSSGSEVIEIKSFQVKRLEAPSKP